MISLNLVLKSLLIILFVFISVAFLTLFERKLLSLIGVRIGPYKVSIGGLLQPIRDAVKLINKQTNILSRFSLTFYFLSSFFIIFCSCLFWVIFNPTVRLVYFKNSLIVILVVFSFRRLISIVSGWRTFSKYSLIGRMRFVTQIISYEASLYLCLFCIIIFYFSLNISMIKEILFFFIVSPFLLFYWIPSCLIELNRTPYDFSEGERELVRGFNTEFGSKGFTLIFLSEYSNIIFISVISAFFFFFFMKKIFLFLFLLSFI